MVARRFGCGTAGYGAGFNCGVRACGLMVRLRAASNERLDETRASGGHVVRGILTLVLLSTPRQTRRLQLDACRWWHAPGSGAMPAAATAIGAQRQAG